MFTITGMVKRILGAKLNDDDYITDTPAEKIQKLVDENTAKCKTIKENIVKSKKFYGLMRKIIQRLNSF